MSKNKIRRDVKCYASNVVFLVCLQALVALVPWYLQCY